MGRLAQYSTEFSQAEAYNPNAAIKDGIYTVRVKKHFADIRNEKDFLSWHLKIEGGPFDGRMLFKSNYLSTPGLLGRLKGDWTTAGAPHLTLEAVDRDPNVLNCLLDVLLEVKVEQQKDNPNFQNVNIRKRLSGPESLLGGNGGGAGTGYASGQAAGQTSAPRNGGSVLPSNAWGAAPTSQPTSSSSTSSATSFNPAEWGAASAGTRP